MRNDYFNAVIVLGLNRMPVHSDRTKRAVCARFECNSIFLLKYSVTMGMETVISYPMVSLNTEILVQLRNGVGFVSTVSLLCIIEGQQKKDQSDSVYGRWCGKFAAAL